MVVCLVKSMGNIVVFLEIFVKAPQENFTVLGGLAQGRGMGYYRGMRVFVEKEAAKYLERLNEPMKGRILDALEKLANEPPEGDIRKLQGQETAYRLRIGDFRVLFKEKTACLAVYKIAPRGQAYKGKK